MSSKSGNSQRQKRWRDRQAQAGLSQVRALVPANRVDDLLLVAAAWRAGKPGIPPTPKQKYDMERLIKKKGRFIPARYRDDGYLLEIWLVREKARPY